MKGCSFYMKRLQVFGLAALSVLLMFGCGQETVEVSEPVVEHIEETPVETSEEEIPDEGLPTEPNMVRSRFTNEWITQGQSTSRPIALMIPNTSSAAQYEISKADILYECNVEGSITRLMAIIPDWQNLDRIGNVRSCRDYYVYWAFEWDAIYIHFGGPFYIDEIIGKEDTQDIDGLSSANFFRTDDTGNTTDNAYVSAEGILADMDKLGYPLSFREGYADEQHYLFAPDSEPNTLTQYADAIDAAKVDMSPTYPVTKCYFIYNEDTGLYDRFQHLSGAEDGPHIDKANGVQLAFKNLIIQNTYFEVRDEKGYLAFQCHDNTRDGWFFTEGKGIHITWEKNSDYGATRYYDDEGNEILLNTGKTMVCIVEDGDSFIVDDEKITSKNK